MGGPVGVFRLGGGVRLTGVPREFLRTGLPTRLKTGLGTGLSVGLGAGFGAVARFAVVLIAGLSSPEALVLAVTFAINCAACFAMGLIAPGPFWGMGFLGGFSTFSAVALACAHMHPLLAWFTISLSIGVAVVAWLLGDAIRSYRHA